MKYIKQLFFTTIVAIWGCFSSCNYLNVDDYFMDTFNYDSIFSNKVNVQRYLWNIPTYFKDEGQIWGNTWTPGITASDECLPTWDTDEFVGVKYARGLITEDGQHRFFTMWVDMYRVVRKVNIILQNIDKCPDLTIQERSEVLGYAYFMRAYAYYNILVDYGPLLLLGDEVPNMNEEMTYYDRPRATYDESVDYVCAEFERAAQYMPNKNALTISQFGRPSKDAAIALIARLRLIHASNAFNGGDAARRYFGNWKRSTDGAFYVAQTPDNERWAQAAHFAKRLIDGGQYALHTVMSNELTPELPANVPSANFPDGAGGIDPYKSYKDMFSGEAVGYKNPEFIWGRYSDAVNGYIRHVFPVGNLQGWGGLGVPQKIIDSYYMADGTEYEKAGINEEEKIDGGISFSGYQLQPGTSKAYAGREMRFYANIGFQNRLWPCNSTTDNSRRNFVANYAKDGNCGKASTTSPTDYTLTGYVPVKYVHDDDAFAGSGATVTRKFFPIIRYAEILLSYAEAINNIEGSYTITDADGNTGTYTRDYNEIAKYFNQVRYRAGLPGIPQGLSREEVNKLIQRERMVELFHENRRYYDVRRWGIYEESETEPIIGMNIEALTDNFFQRVRVNHINVKTRMVSPKLVLVPIWKNELRKMPSLDQNPGWTK